MFNISMKYGVSESARLLGVDRFLIKKWAYLFSDYLSSEANPGKEKVRVFTITDLRIFAFVLMYWEDEPDIENIKWGLNSRDCIDCPPIDNFLTEITPLFQDMPDGIDETWRGVVFGGDFELRDIFSTAESFKTAGDKLVELAANSDDDRELFQPAIYNYRHAMELYMKAIVGVEKTHNLAKLLNKLKQEIKLCFNEDLPKWFENLVEGFSYIDPSSTAFRYSITLPSEEIYIDMRHVKKLMDWSAKAFRNIREVIY